MENLAGVLLPVFEMQLETAGSLLFSVVSVLHRVLQTRNLLVSQKEASVCKSAVTSI
jgi:hypothetical protein